MNALTGDHATAQTLLPWSDAAHRICREITSGDLHDPLHQVVRYAAQAAGGDDDVTLLPAGASVETVVISSSDGRRMLVPVRDSLGVRAVLCFTRSPDRAAFTDAELDLATMYAGQAAYALELADGPARRDRAVRTDERDRIAREMSADVIGRLFALGLALQGAAGVATASSREQFERGIAEIDETVKLIRSTIYRLATRPPAPPR